jgi:programmed cell death 6-interacting protein
MRRVPLLPLVFTGKVLIRQDDLKDHIPSTTSSSSLPASVRPLRASLEELDDRIANRARIIQDARGLARADDIRPQVLAEAGRMAHGGSGDVRAEWFEGIFDKGLEKYEGAKGEMAREEEKQKVLLERLRVSYFMLHMVKSHS